MKRGVRMNYVLPVLLGLVWGALFALLGGLIMRRALAKNTNAAVLAGTLLRTALDLAALGLLYLARGVLPFDWGWMLIAAALSLTVGLILVSFRLARKK